MISLIKRAILHLRPQTGFVPNDDVCVVDAPSAQATIDTISGWICTFPTESGVDTGGYANIFDDPRAKWAIAQLGGIEGLDVVELGPLEGSHTYMLDRAGAKSVIAIESLKRSYLKCLITKEVLSIKNAKFLLGNFVPWLANQEKQFDVIWASGVLYHMTEPLTLLELIAKHTNKLYLWTHYYPDDFSPHKPYPRPLVRIRDIDFHGHIVPHFERSYRGVMSRAIFSGGVFSGASWLRRRDILMALDVLGFKQIEIGSESCNGERPSFALVAKRC